jgi:hypothetical protein
MAAWVSYGEEGKVLVRVAAELIIVVEHLAPPVHFLGCWQSQCSGGCNPFI